jgi:hypothetical protein
MGKKRITHTDEEEYSKDLEEAQRWADDEYPGIDAVPGLTVIIEEKNKDEKTKANNRVLAGVWFEVSRFVGEHKALVKIGIVVFLGCVAWVAADHAVFMLTHINP